MSSHRVNELHMNIHKIQLASSIQTHRGIGAQRPELRAERQGLSRTQVE